MIAIVDYEIGNLAAIANMFNRLGVLCEITADPAKIENADKIVLPGNGAFDACMQSLRATGLIPLLNEKVLTKKTPLLGICVGAQMLGVGSEEGNEAGLGWMDIEVKRFPALPNLRVPHMGWCHVKNVSQSHPHFEKLSEDARFYFVHSYYLDPANAEEVLLTANYGKDFAAAVGKDNIVGVQFHPEKSHRFGKQLLAQFAGLPL
jgi:imidazole glycerol-phosphate synthase subunit HisH